MIVRCQNIIGSDSGSENNVSDAYCSTGIVNKITHPIVVHLVNVRRETPAMRISEFDRVNRCVVVVQTRCKL
jgi:hypothetical protein